MKTSLEDILNKRRALPGQHKHFEMFSNPCSKCGVDHSEGAGICKACNTGYDKYKVIYFAKLPNGMLVTKTLKKYRKKSDEDQSIEEEIGDEIDVLWPFIKDCNPIDQNLHETFHYPSILKEDKGCSCERIKRLTNSFADRKGREILIKDETLIKVFNHWETIFSSNIPKPASFYELLKLYKK
jgi:hypothetical protein